jgi:hypothetical protein
MQNTILKKDKSNVLSMENWKKYLVESIQSGDHERYLEVLNFNQLISEATETLSKLKNDSLDDKLITRSKLLLQEFNRRMDSLSEEFSNSLEGIRSKVDSKIKELDHKLLK